MTTPAGWYPDPSAPGSQRWFDGSSWTDQVRPAEAAPAPPPPRTGMSTLAKALLAGAAGVTALGVAGARTR